MKNLLFVFILFSVFISCSKKVTIELTNQLPVERTDEVVVLNRDFIESKTGKINENIAPVVILNGVNIPSQVDDLNGDKIWDELAFVINFQSQEKIKLEIKLINQSEYPEFEKRTNVRLGIHQEDGSYSEVNQYFALSCRDSFKIIAQGESVSWENDKIGFRTYFDCRNVKDLYGKLLPGMIIDKIHTPEIPDYHVLNDWGMDVLHCGSSLGSGGLAILEADSLYRLGSTESYEYKKVTEGPVRSVFDLIYTGWKVADQNLTATERISIYPGKYWFQSDVTVTGFTGQKQIVTGIVTSLLKNDPFDFDAGTGYRSIGTLDKQSLNNDELGMAVMVSASEVTKVARTTDIDFFSLGYKTVDAKKFSNVISQTYYIAQNIEADTPARHYFFSVWGLENEEWRKTDNFKSYISEQATLIGNKIQIK